MGDFYTEQLVNCLLYTSLPVKYGGHRGRIISFDSLIVQWREDSKIVEAIADTIFAFRRCV